MSTTPAVIEPGSCLEAYSSREHGSYPPFSVAGLYLGAQCLSGTAACPRYPTLARQAALAA
ncbi:hypothetical protein C8Q79DRAFT_933526 [Trametes meyenii]|nr:hypothetical protein C8Q79DRAFT_933526 [Trametes meyenii]